MEMTDVEMLYRYCMRKNLTFSYTESKEYKSVIFQSEKTHRLFSYTWSKIEEKPIRIRIDDNHYENVDNALQDFDDYELLSGKKGVW